LDICFFYGSPFWRAAVGRHTTTRLATTGRHDSRHQGHGTSAGQIREEYATHLIRIKCNMIRAI
jgi:hypothetical protein